MNAQEASTEDEDDRDDEGPKSAQDGDVQGRSSPATSGSDDPEISFKDESLVIKSPKHSSECNFILSTLEDLIELCGSNA